MPKARNGSDKELRGAKKPGGGTCRNPAGTRTTHLGTGRCYRHGGSTRNHGVKAEQDQAIERMRTYGSPIDIAPDAALTEEVRRTVGHVKWLGEVVVELLHGGDGYEVSTDEEGKTVFTPRSRLKQMDTSGKFEKPAVWVDASGIAAHAGPRLQDGARRWGG